MSVGEHARAQPPHAYAYACTARRTSASAFVCAHSARRSSARSGPASAIHAAESAPTECTATRLSAGSRALHAASSWAVIVGSELEQWKASRVRACSPVA